MHGLRLRYLWLALAPTLVAGGAHSFAQTRPSVRDVWVSKLLASAAAHPIVLAGQGAPATPPGVGGDVGTTNGSFAVGPSGSATYVIPIPCPPGTAGMQPALNLSYDSQGPTGSLGIGWSVGGLTSICRGLKNTARDGVVGGVALRSDDAFFLDGARLIPVRLDPTTGATEYRSESDPTSVVVSSGDGEDGPRQWRVTTKAGLTLEFGVTENSRIKVSRTLKTPTGSKKDVRVLSWACERITDTLGNYIHFAYVADGRGDHDIQRVAYTGNERHCLQPYAEIDFTYEAAPKPSHGYLSGFEVVRPRRLQRIRSSVDGTTMCQFHLEYEDRDSVARFRLRRITEGGRGGGEYRPLRFAYTESEAGWDDSATHVPPLRLGTLIPAGENPGPLDDPRGVVYADVNHDGRIDFLYAAATAGVSRRVTCLNTPNGWEPSDALKSPIDFSADGRRDPAIRVADIDGDGWPDIVRALGPQATSGIQDVWLNADGTKWASTGFVLPAALGAEGAPDTSTLLLDLDGDGKLDVAWRRLDANGSEDKGAFLFEDGIGWKKAAAGFTPPFPIVAHDSASGLIADARGVLLIDVDCDGFRDLVYHRLVKGVAERNVFLRNTNRDKWEETLEPLQRVPFDPPANPASMLVLHLDRDEFEDLFVSMPAVAGPPPRSEILGAFAARPLVNSSGGWTEVSGLKDPPFHLAVDATMTITARPARLVDRFVDGAPTNHTEDLLLATEYVDSATKRRVVISQAYENGGAAGWVLRSGYRPPFVFSKDGVERTTFVEDLTKDGLSDLVEHDLDSGSPVVRAYLWSPERWLPAEGLTPPERLAEPGGSDVGVRLVDINGDGRPDFLRRLRRGGTDAPADRVAHVSHSTLGKATAWDEDPSFVPPIPTASSSEGDGGTRIIDITGDGLPDFVVARTNSDGTKVAEAWENLGSGTGEEKSAYRIAPHYEPPFQLFTPEHINRGTVFLDINGDGLLDAMTARLESDDPTVDIRSDLVGFRWALWINAGPTASGASRWEQVKDERFRPPVEVVTNDFPFFDAPKLFEKPDGKIVRLLDDPQSVPHINKRVGRDTKALITDLNGDGLPDIAWAFLRRGLREVEKQKGDDGLTYRRFERVLQDTRGARLGSPNGWVNAPGYVLPPTRFLDATTRDKQLHPALLDVNGDGLPDLVFTKRQITPSDPLESEVLLNTGDGWAEADLGKPWIVPNDAIAEGDGDPGFRFADVNGDGLVDILFGKDDENHTPLRPYRAWLNMGHGADVSGAWKSSDEFSPKIALAWAKQDEDLGVRVADINGDGLPDLVRAFGSDSDAANRKTWLNRSRRRDMLRSIVNGLELQIDVEYRSFASLVPVAESASERFYEPAKSAGTYPIIRATPPAYLVHEVLTREYYLSPEEELDSGLPRLERPPQQPQVFRYRYGEFRLDVRAARPLGFAWRETRNETKTSARALPLGNREYASFNQDGVLSGRIQEVRNSSASLDGVREYKVAKTAWRAAAHDALPRPDGVPYRYYSISLERISSESFDLDGSSAGGESTSYRYDAWGNVIELVTARSDGSTSRTVSVYPDVGTAVREGRMASSTVTLQGDDGSQSVRRAEFKYDPASRILTEETAYAGTLAQTVTSYELDRFGNRVSALTRCVDCVPRMNKTQFDNRGRFAVERTNALGHTTRLRYDEVFGSPTEVTDPNGVVTRVTYDAHGRVASQTSATGVVARTSFTWLPYAYRPSSGALFATVTEVDGLPPTESWADCRSRTLREVAVGWRGQRIIKDTEFDALGRTTRFSEPYFESTLPINILWTETRSFDALSRPLVIVAPNGAEISYGYQGLRTSVTDALKRRTSTLKNARGLLVSTTDATGHTLRLVYDAADRLVETVAPDGPGVRYEYDIAGRRTRMLDPDLGMWTYRYNGFGELVSQRDARGQEATLSYDLLGRLVRRQDADILTLWQYDIASHGIGALATIRSSDGYSQSYQYDDFGRATETTTIVKGRSFTSRVAFDKLDRVVATTYPSGFVAKNAYDVHGLISECSDASDGSTIWKPLAVNQRGQVTLEQLGNGVTSVAAFEDSTGRVTEVAAAWSSGLAVSYHHYTYDLLGNVTQREDRVHGTAQSFEYDSLDRLIRSRGSEGRDVTLRYSPTGAIAFKSDVGTYRYDPVRGPAHGVSEIHGLGGTSAHFDYDANGALVSGPKGRFSYTAANRVREIIHRSGRSTFEYTPSGQRCYEESCSPQVLTRTTSIGLYEEIDEQNVPPSRRRSDWMRGWEYQPHEDGGTWLASPRVRTRQRSHVAVAGRVVAIHEFITECHQSRTGSRSTTPQDRIDHRPRFTQIAKAYLHRDAIGSIVAVTDAVGKLIERLTYDEWGARSNDGPARHHTLRDGFTGHLHLDGPRLIHMNARVYDPDIARFVSADTFLDGPESAQGYDRYSYVHNNPLRWTDPTGHFFFLFDFFAGIVKAIVNAVAAVINAAIEAVKAVIELAVKAIQAVGNFIAENWRTILTVAAVVVATVATAGLAASGVAGLIASGAIAGAVGSGLSTALYGGSLGDIFLSMFKGAVIGGISAGAFNAAGGIADNALRIGAHAGVGGAVEAAQGGDFLRGALSGAVSCASGFVASSSTPPVRIATAAVVGGTTSAIGGGKFENGAMTGAFGCAFNDLLHEAARPARAFAHYVEGSGDLVEMEFAVIGADDVSAKDFPYVRSVLDKGGTTGMCISKERMSFRSPTWSGAATVGQVTLGLSGSLEVFGGMYRFEGRLGAFNDTYDFNRMASGHRTWLGEASTLIGRMTPGTPYEIRFVGGRRLNEFGTSR